MLRDDFVFTLTGGLAALLGVDADDEGGDPAIAMGDGACFGIILGPFAGMLFKLKF